MAGSRAQLVQALNLLLFAGETTPPVKVETISGQSMRRPAAMAGAKSLVDDQGRAEAIRDRAQPWTATTSIQGFGVGRKITAAATTDVLAIRVYVDRKQPTKAIENPVPKTVEIPTLGRVPTDVIEIGKMAPELSTERLRPALAGSSVGLVGLGDAGTFGGLVRRRGSTDGKIYILSNSHVLADSGNAAIGSKLLQPGEFDGGIAGQDEIASLTAFVPFDLTTANLVDAAIAEVDDSALVSAELRLRGQLPKGTSTALREGLAVQKIGRTTDFTVGSVLDIDHVTQIDYGTEASPKIVRFRDQVLCTRYTAAGDSGSLVLNNAGRVVGLHFAGSASASVFNKIKHVVKLLDIEFVTASL